MRASHVVSTPVVVSQTDYAMDYAYEHEPVSVLHSAPVYEKMAVARPVVYSVEAEPYAEHVYEPELTPVSPKKYSITSIDRPIVSYKVPVQSHGVVLEKARVMHKPRVVNFVAPVRKTVV